MISLYNEVKKEMEAEEAAKAVEDAKKRREAEEAAKKYDAWVDEIEKLAQRESTTVENSRWIAAIPFGVGQFQNDDIGLGVLFASAEGSAVVVAVVTGVLHADLVARGKVKQSQQTPEDEEDQLVTEELNANLRALQIANNVSMGALAALIIAGIIEAEVNFVPETPRSRQRKVPKRPPKPKPVVSVTGPPAGGTSGVGLRLDF